MLNRIVPTIIFLALLAGAGCKKSTVSTVASDSATTAHKGDSLFHSSLDSIKGTAGYKKIHDSVMRSLGLIGWRYSSDTDNMRNQITEFAHLESDNELEFDSPYDGGSSGQIMLRKKGSKSDVLLIISKGQFNSRVDGVMIPVKFDDSPVQNYSGHEPEGGNSDALFIEPANRFIARLKNAHHVIVEAPFYESGRQQLTFSSDSLKWE